MASASDDATARMWVREYVTGSDQVDFRNYAREFAEGVPRRFFWLMEEIVRLGRMREGRILDVGCGFGWQAVALSILAHARVVANDIRPLMTSTVDRRVAALRDRGAPVAIEALTGDICDLDLPDASFDAIVCNQTIEHVHDLGRMLLACHRLLRPGGRIVITNDNNALNRRQLDEIRAMWQRRDTDWGYIQELKGERPEENRDIQPYAAMRASIIAAANPELRPDDAERMARATAGLTRPAIERLAAAYTPGGALPTPPRLSWCRNPETGEYCERQLDPFAVADLMRASGFEAQVRHGFRRRPLSWLNGLSARPLNHFLYQLGPFFLLVGAKAHQPAQAPAPSARVRPARGVAAGQSLTG